MPSTYRNGRLPETILRRLDSGTATGRGRHVTTDASAVRWYGFRRDVLRETGVTLHISPGMNAYRDYAEQGVGRANACAQGNCAAAASQGSSSHGGNMAYAFTGWVRVDAMAFDIGDYWRIPWAVFKRIAERWGFEVGRITKAIAGIEEPWHIIDRRPYQSLREVEALYSVTLTRGADGVYRLADIEPTRPKEWDEMATPEEIRSVVAGEIAKVTSRPTQSVRTVHARTEGAAEWTLGDPLVGRDLDEFKGSVTATNRRDLGDGVFEFRGFLVTADQLVGVTWARIYAKGNLGEHSRTDRAGYIAIQRELSRVATAEAQNEPTSS